MQSESVTPSPPTASLPPVTPPTGKFIVQLFLVPGLIVGLIVGLLMVVYWLFGGPRSPDTFLKKLDDPNPEVRWRAAADLSQVLPRDPRLAADPEFCLQLCERLDRALTDSEPLEKAFLERLPRLDKNETVAERKKLEPERDYIQYLTSSLGYFLMPTGAPLLCRIIDEPGGLELEAQTFRRRTALKALACTGEELRQFSRLTALNQDQILAQMRQLDETAPAGQPRKWNQAALACLEKRKAGQYTTMGVDRALVKAAGSDDPATREFAAYTMGFWKGDAEQDRRMDEALERLASDDGRGRDRLEEFQGPEPGEMRDVLRQPGLLVQINATMSLLRHGSDRVRPGKVAEMLNLKQLGEDIQVESKNGKREPAQSKVVMTVWGTLHALADYYHQRPADSLPGIPERIKKLADDANTPIQMAAREALKAQEAAPK